MYWKIAKKYSKEILILYLCGLRDLRSTWGQLFKYKSIIFNEKYMGFMLLEAIVGLGDFHLEAIQNVQLSSI